MGAARGREEQDRQVWPTATVWPTRQSRSVKAPRSDQAWKQRLLRPFRVLDFGHRAVRQILAKRQAPWGTEYKVAWEDTWVPEAVLLRDEYALGEASLI